MPKTSAKFFPEVRERAVRLVREHPGEHDSLGAAFVSIASKIGGAAGDAAPLDAREKGTSFRDGQLRRIPDMT